jgi:mannosyltransferase
VPHPVRSSTTSNAAILLITGLLLAAFLIATIDIRRESLWNDEAWTAWAVRSPYIRDTLLRVEADVHPPLYFLLLTGLGRFTGDSVLALRWPSALFGMLGLAGTYALGKFLFDRRTGLIAIMLLGSASFFVYYTREARMYSLVMAIATIATLMYVKWRKVPSIWRAISYGIMMAILLYTHYAGIFIVATHVVHLTISQIFPHTRLRKNLLITSLPYFIGAVLFLPWLPIFLHQMRTNPNGPLAIPVPTNWAAVAAIILILTGGSWGLIIAPFVIGKAVPKLRQYGNFVLLLVLWLVITPVALLALNQWFAPVYQVRYIIGMLPAGALIVAHGLRQIELPSWFRIGKLSGGKISTLVATLLLIWLVYIQVSTFQELWPPKPAWDATIRQMIAARTPSDATISDLAAYSPSAYYDRQLGLKHGIGLDLSWRLHTQDEVQSLVKKLDTEQSIWVALPVNTAKSWQVVSQLNVDHTIGYRSGLSNMIFYRFDQSRDAANQLAFQFGDAISYEDSLPSQHLLQAKSGERLCTEVKLKTLTDIDNSYSIGLHLVDLTGNINAAQWDEGFGQHAANESVTITPCLEIGNDIPSGHYHLELTIYNWATLERMQIVETSGNSPIGWGDVLMMQAVDVNP